MFKIEPQCDVKQLTGPNCTDSELPKNCIHSSTLRNILLQHGAIKQSTKTNSPMHFQYTALKHKYIHLLVEWLEH